MRPARTYMHAHVAVPKRETHTYHRQNKRTRGHEAVHVHLLLLAVAPHARSRLLVVGRVPAGVCGKRWCKAQGGNGGGV